MNKILVLLFAVASVASATFLGKNENGIPIFKIQLDLPAERRFDETSIYFKDAVRKTMDAYLSLIPEFIFELVNIVGGAIRYI